MERYFLGNNTAHGFVGNYEDSLKGVDKAILLKGGPGTGKSTILKKLAAEAQRRGYDYELWYCSGDPQSLDGVYVKDINVAVVDATAPHATGADLPAIKDFIVDLASSLSSEKLKRDRADIEALLSRKKRHFKRVYEHLNTAYCHYSNILNIQSESFDAVKLRAFAAKFAAKVSGEFDGSRGASGTRRVYNVAISPSGENAYYDHLDGKYIYEVVGGELAVKTFFDQFSSLIGGGLFALNPLDGTSTLGAVSDNVAIVAAELSNAKANEVIDLSEYLDVVDVESADEERNAMTVEIAKAIEHLNAARDMHLAAEKYFVAAMDFANNDKLYRELVKSVYGA